MKLLKVSAILLFLVPLLAFAHSGGQDKNGGHINKKTGKYHCHKSTCKPKNSVSISAENRYPTPTRVMAKEGKYVRKEWKHWSDFDGDCQDSRAETLIKSSKTPVKFKTKKSCEVVSGSFFDPFTGNTYTSDNSIDIDHIVPLNEAHHSGGFRFSSELKEKFANDPDNLLAVYLGQNRSKGDKHPGIWMPKNVNYHCEYINKWIHVKTKYNLHIRKSVLLKQKKICN